MTAAAADARLAWLDARFPAAARLAELASFAARIDSGLLRRLRWQLLPDTDVSAESELWFSPIVESRSQTGFQIAPEVLALLRVRLLMPSRPPVAIVRQALAHAHAQASPAIRLEEEINGIALQYGPAAQTMIEERLRSVLIALAGGGDDAIDVARWFVPAVPRLHPLVRQAPIARTIALSAALLLRGRTRLGSVTPDPSIPISTLGWALSGSLDSQRIGVEFVEGGLQFRQRSATAAYVDAPITDPAIVEVEWISSTGVQRRLTPAADAVLVPLEGDPEEVIITTLLGDQYRVSATPGAWSGRARRPAFPPSTLLAACDQVQLLGHDVPLGVVFAIGERLLLGVSTVIGRTPFFAVYGRTQQLEVIGSRDLPIDDGSPAVVALRPVDDPGTRPVWMPLPLVTPVEDGALRAAAAGFVRGNSSWYDVALEPAADTQGTRRGVLFRPPSVSPDDLVAGFIGAPLVIGQRVMGVIVRITPPQPQERYAAIEILEGSRLRAAVASATPEPAVSHPFVFLSYVREDEPQATTVLQSFEDAGFTVFFDRRDVRAGDDWAESIRNAINDADLFIPLISRRTISRDVSFFNTEWRYAQERWRRLSPDVPYVVPIVIDATSPSDPGIPEFLRQFHIEHAPEGVLPAGLLESLRARREPSDNAGRTSIQKNVDVVGVRDSIESFMDVLLDQRAKQAILELAFTPRPRVLVVNGSKLSALDEVPFFIDRSIRHEVSLKVALHHVVLRSLSTFVTGDELAAYMAEQAGLNIAEMPRSSVGTGRGFGAFSQWLVSAVVRAGVRRIFLLDGVDENSPPDVYDLVNELFTAIDVDMVGSTRLILLNFDVYYLSKYAQSIVPRIDLKVVDERAIDQYIRDVMASTGPYEPSVLEKVKQPVLNLMASPGSWDYHDVRRLLLDAARLLTDRNL